jgi:type II secretion system protein C
MINKFKDFLKSKLSRKNPSNLDDQDDFPDQSATDDDAIKPSWKEKLKLKLPSLRKKTETDAGEEFEPTLSLSWKDKVRSSLTTSVKLPEGFKSKKGEGLHLLSPSLSKSIEKFLSREARETIHQVSLVIVICGVTYTLGKVTALFLRGAPSLNSDKDYVVQLDLQNDFNPGTLTQVKSINIFRTNSMTNGGKKQVADTKCDKAQQESSLPIKLVNTIVLQDTVKSLASVQVRGDKDLQEVREGDQISDIAKIFKITRLEILVKNLESGICESIASEKAREAGNPISVMSPAQSRQFKASKKMSGIDNVGNKFAISKALLDDKMKNIAAILTQARAVKIQNPDGTMAFKLTEMDPNGIFPYLGLQDQDIITSINGKPIYDMNEVMSLFAKIKNLDNLSLGVKREGSDSVQEYSIKK